METPKYEIELVREIWNNKSGVCAEVRQDKDALGLVEVILKEDSLPDKILIFEAEQARLVASAMIALANELDPPQN